MKAFQYVRAVDADQAIGESSRNPRAKFLGGGTNLVDLMKYGVETPDRLIDVTRLPLNQIEDLADGGLRIGALVRNSDLADDSRIKQRYPVLSQALLSGASPQLRNMATTGGNLLQRTRCYYFYDTAFPCNKRTPGSGCSAIGGQNRIHAILGASPQCVAVHPSDMAVAMALLDATVHVTGAKGPRAIPILEFHRLPGSTPDVDSNLQHDELITSIDLPALPVARMSAYRKIRDRATYAFALVSVAAALTVDQGIIREARVALGGVAHMPWRVLAAEQSLVGRQAGRESYEHSAGLILAGAAPLEHNAFKVELARRAIIRSLEDLAAGGAAS